MNKIIRLSKANINRHKKETILLGVLIFLCAVLLASSVTDLLGIKKITPQMVEESGCYKNFIYVDQSIYADGFLTFLDEDERVTDYSHASVVYWETKVKTDQSDKEVLFAGYFIAENEERELEKFEIVTSLSDEQIKNLEHPIYLGKSEKEFFSVKEGDELSFFINNKEYSFTVAGFYDSGISMFGARMVVSEKDFEILEGMEPFVYRYEIIGFDVIEEADADEVIKGFKDFVNEVSINETKQGIRDYSYRTVVENNEMNMSYVSRIILIMAGVIIIAVFVMIRFRIVTDISEQMTSIGVLEAIGYKSNDIALSFIFEYVFIALTGCILAFVPSIFTAAFLLERSALTVNYCGQVDISYITICFVMISILLFIAFVAMTKALAVHKYPPVMALRKGIATHHFKKTYLPLDKTKGNVHIRLAFKDFLQNIRERTGFMVCISVTSFMLLISFILGNFFMNEEEVLRSVCGHEMADIKLVATGGTDPEQFAEELRNMPEVESVLLSAAGKMGIVNDKEWPFMIDIYEDFSETETIVVIKGRLPKHDNEIAVSSQGPINNLMMGQTVTVEYDKVKRDYIICGVVNSLMDANTIYMTEDGFKKMDPLYVPNAYRIYLRYDADREAFAETLKARYGDEITNNKNSEETGDTLEERIKNAAEIKMAKAMSESGVSYMEYEIRIGDKIITGSTHNMEIQALEYEYDHYVEIMESIQKDVSLIVAVLMAVSVTVVIILLSILMSSTVRKQYKELGIMKGLGYTSGELKFQMAFKILPLTVIGVVVGSIISIGLIKLIALFVAKITVSFVNVIFVDFGILLFCFLCGYVNANKIGKITVYELMTE